jgi:hypothetical protein
MQAARFERRESRRMSQLAILLLRESQFYAVGVHRRDVSKIRRPA